MLNKVLVTVLIVGLVVSLAANVVLDDRLAGARKDALETQEELLTVKLETQGDWDSFLECLALADRLVATAESEGREEPGLLELRNALEAFLRERELIY